MKRIIEDFNDNYKLYGLLTAFRFLVADYLNKNPDYCNALLTVWALGYESLLSIFDTEKYKKRDCLKDKYAWCGKCQREIDIKRGEK